jgi:hypothetical protein
MAFRIGKKASEVDLEEVLDATMLELLREVVSAGALVSIGASRDMGALSVTVTMNGEWDREWFRTAEELHEWLKEAAVVVRDMTPSPSTGSRRRRSS